MTLRGSMRAAGRIMHPGGRGRHGAHGPHHRLDQFESIAATSRLIEESIPTPAGEQTRACDARLPHRLRST